MIPFARVAIVGVGLVGGSLGMALRARGLASKVVGVTRTAETIEVACARGAIDSGTVTPEDGVAGADLIVLATPPDLVVPMALRVLPHLEAGVLLTDVTSVKGEIVRSIEAAAASRGVEFVGGHPMAGNEGRGVEAASADLFEGAAYVVTPTPRTAPSAVARLSELARGLGARPMVLSPDEHDRAVAIVSHLPYLVAAALVGVSGGAGRAVGPGFLGATRVAGSPVELWTQICRLNQGPITEALRAFQSELVRLEAGLADGARLGAMLEQARAARVQLAKTRGDG